MEQISLKDFAQTLLDLSEDYIVDAFIIMTEDGTVESKELRLRLFRPGDSAEYGLGVTLE